MRRCRRLQLVIDGRPLVGHRTGIGVHTAEIAQRLPLSPPPLIASHTEISDRSGLESCRFRVDEAVLGVAWQQLTLPRIEADVVWAPHGTLPLTLSAPAVITIHDFTSITSPGRHRLKTVLSFNPFIGQSIEKAARIACVSRSVADQLMRGFAPDSRKIEVVPNGVDEYFSPGGGESDFILFTGTLEPRKGLDDLIDVWRSLASPRPRLLLCGAGGWKVRIPKIEGLETTGYVSREELRELYRSAIAFVYPSHEEGFGIPPLEAMACGAAVIATRTGAIPEFASGAALLVAPRDRDALRSALMRVLHERSLRSELRRAAAERAREWRWDRSAAAMASLIEAAARV